MTEIRSRLPLTPALYQTLKQRKTCEIDHLRPFTPTDGLMTRRFGELWEEVVPRYSPTISSLGRHLFPLCLPPLHLTDAGVELSSSKQLEEREQKPKKRLDVCIKKKKKRRSEDGWHFWKLASYSSGMFRQARNHLSLLVLVEFEPLWSWILGVCIHIIKVKDFLRRTNF